MEITLAVSIACLFGAFVVGTATNVAAVMLPPTRGRARAPVLAASLLLTSAVLALPFFLPGPPVVRAVLAQALVIESWRVLEILRSPRPYARRERAIRVILLPFEMAFLERGPQRWPVRELIFGGVLFAIGVAGIIFASTLSPAVTPFTLRGWPRWLVAGAFGYVAMEGMTRQWVDALPVFGFRHRRYQRHPVLSRTVAEFWGVRWSSVVNRWLRSNVYEPLARRGLPRTGIASAFAASAVMHAYMIWPAAGPVPAMWMLAFFALHGVVVVVEGKLRVRRWPAFAAHAFVVAVFVVTVPLFMEPLLRAVGF